MNPLPSKKTAVALSIILFAASMHPVPVGCGAADPNRNNFFDRSRTRLRKTISAFQTMRQCFCFAHSCSRTLCNIGKEYGTPSIFLRALWRHLV